MRRQYPFHLIEPKWQRFWETDATFRAWNPGDVIPAEHPFAKRHGLNGEATVERLPRKFYILDMFPYPSGAGLHVGHPEGYTATDILARYRRARGCNVLHPMGWDAFGLPAEQYAIRTGQHPRETTEENIAVFKRQIQSLGFSYDWSRELDTTDPHYFRWTQWIFLQFYNSWFNPATGKAEPIDSLPTPGEGAVSPEALRQYRDSRRLAYVSEAPVWWCEELGTVLANEEVIDGRSEVGGFPVVRRPMRQWMLRITAYADRLLQGLEQIDWSESLKEMQRNWIGRSEGAEVDFRLADRNEKITVFTTRPDTLFGATYMVLAPEHKLVDAITTDEHRLAVANYKAEVTRKSDLQREEAREKTGVSTGAYAVNPVNGERIPVWIADYVLASYGTGAIMAVPGHDTRDLEFARKFGLEVRVVVQAPGGQDSMGFLGDGISVNSGFLTGLRTSAAKQTITARLKENGAGHKTVNYKLRDWLFSRQRYWGEPFPIVWKRDANGVLYHEALPESALPVLPPSLEDYKPTRDGQPPLARAADWVNLPDGSTRETNTMPQWAGSCWYYLRFTDAKNPNAFVGKEAEDYWMGAGYLAWERQLRELYDFALNNPRNEKRFVTIGRVGEEEGRQIESQTGFRLTGYRRFVDNYAIVHIMHEHGDSRKESERGLIAVTFEDLLSIPEIVACPDKIISAGKTATGLDGILYEKEINGWICYVEEVRTKHDLLATKTLYKKPAAASHAGEGPAQTSETLRRTGTNVTQTGGNYKQVSPGVDLYVGGIEHAVLHLLYSRFWHNVLYDLGHLSTQEPFFKLVNQGLILGEDGQKMSKSRGNVVNPDDILGEYGADAFRLYEMFMGPLEMVKPWNTKGVEGVYRFLGRVWRLFIDEESETEFEQAQTASGQNDPEALGHLKLSASIRDTDATPAQLKTLHSCIKKVTEDLEGLRFNTAISALMIFINEAITWKTKPAAVLREFLILLQPFAPHLAEELYAKLGGPNAGNRTMAYEPWPKYDPALLVEQTIEMPVQVNGKLRDKIVVAAGASAAEIEAAGLAAEKVRPFVAGKTVKKVIVVPGRLVNIVV